MEKIISNKELKLLINNCSKIKANESRLLEKFSQKIAFNR